MSHSDERALIGGREDELSRDQQELVNRRERAITYFVAQERIRSSLNIILPQFGFTHARTRNPVLFLNEQRVWVDGRQTKTG